MLVDVEFRRPDPITSMILGLIGDSGPTQPQRIGQGMYVCGHWSVDQLIKVRERWRESPIVLLDFNEYGVCDAPEQAVEKLRLRERPEQFFVSFVKLRRADQPREGGWRWHKWGEYIGTRERQCEYLHDEPDIEEVYTFHVYEPDIEEVYTFHVYEPATALTA